MTLASANQLMEWDCVTHSYSFGGLVLNDNVGHRRRRRRRRRACKSHATSSWPDYASGGRRRIMLFKLRNEHHITSHTTTSSSERASVVIKKWPTEEETKRLELHKLGRHFFANVLRRKWVFAATTTTMMRLHINFAHIIIIVIVAASLSKCFVGPKQFVQNCITQSYQPVAKRESFSSFNWICIIIIARHFRSCFASSQGIFARHWPAGRPSRVQPKRDRMAFRLQLVVADLVHSSVIRERVCIKIGAEDEKLFSQRASCCAIIVIELRLLYSARNFFFFFFCFFSEIITNN